MRSLFRDEAVPAPISTADDGTFLLTVAIHMLPASEIDAVVAELLPDWKNLGVTSSPAWSSGARTSSPVDTPLYRTLEQAVREAHPGIPVGPYFLPWTATDSRYFRAAGIASYGFSPFLLSVTETLQIGQPNERMQLPGFVEGTRLYREVVRRLVD
jgi:acetylornithine deacetylase/succinyl-diaminopimelate desuccinylase-like protein